MKMKNTNGNDTMTTIKGNSLALIFDRPLCASFDEAILC